MDELFEALGWEKGAVGSLRILAAVGTVSAGFAFGGYLVSRETGIPVWLLQLILWVPWLVWLGWIFPRHYTRAGGYKAGFFRHILPGISWNFAQMARPTVVGLMSSGRPFAQPWLALAGLAIGAAGCGLVARAVRIIGIPHALFLGEYVPASRRLAVTGVYRALRHPMFLGGMALSVGLSLLVWSGQTLAMDLATVAVLPWYRRCEDGRCQAVYANYDGYRHSVAGLVPRRATSPVTLAALRTTFSQGGGGRRDDAA